MPRKLKTYQTTLGFFELAVAAPSMKAALEAWGSKDNLFQMGFAKESDNPSVIAAAMAKPGVVLRRGVGTSGKFSEHAKLPASLPDSSSGPQPSKVAKPGGERRPPSKHGDSEATRSLAAAKRSQAEKEQQRQKAELRRQKAVARREAAIAKAKAELDQVEEQHQRFLEELAAKRAELDRVEAQEETRWHSRQQQLEAELAKWKRG